MTKRTCPNGHVVRGKKPTHCPQCGEELPLLPPRKKWPIIVGILGIVAVCGIIAIAVGNGEEPGGGHVAEATTVPGATEQPAQPIAPTPTRTPTPSPAPTPTLSLKDHFTLAVADNKPAGCKASPEIEYYKALSTLGAMLKVHYEIEVVLTDRMAIRDCVRSFLKTAPAAYSCDPRLDVLNVDYVATFTDVYGKQAQDSFLRIQIKRATADKIVWENMLICNVSQIVETFKLHPSLRDAWAEECP